MARYAYAQAARSIIVKISCSISQRNRRPAMNWKMIFGPSLSDSIKVSARRQSRLDIERRLHMRRDTNEASSRVA